MRGSRQVCLTHVLGLVRREFHPRAAAVVIPPDGDVEIIIEAGRDKTLPWWRIEALLDGSRCECGCELDPAAEPWPQLELELDEPDRRW